MDQQEKNNLFINKLKDKYSDEYIYTHVVYKTSKSIIKLICKKHGEFEQRADYLLKSGGCKLCKSLNNYLIKSKTAHNNFYDYSKICYINSHTPVIIICPIHGEFKQNLNNHSNGQICPKCSYENKFNNNDNFIKKAKEIYNDKYDYSKVDYINAKTKVQIICPSHGSFHITPQQFLYNKTGCKKCSLEKKSDTLYDFIKKSNIVHNNKYDYSKVKYINSRTKVTITCTIHGDFDQLPNLHIHRRTGCPKCSISKNEKIITQILEENNITFISQKKFTNCKDKRTLPFDFFLPDYNLCIEYDGEQHFKSIKYFGGDKKLTEIKKHDTIKNDFCYTNNIELLRIRYDENVAEKIFEYFYDKNKILS